MKSKKQETPVKNRRLDGYDTSIYHITFDIFLCISICREIFSGLNYRWSIIYNTLNWVQSQAAK